jgi:uncharacterized membrane protein
MQSALLYALAFAATGMMFCLISVPLIKGKVPRNHWYGFRTPKTLRSDSVWYPVNSYSGKCLYVSGLIITAGSLLLIPLGLFCSTETIALIGFAVTMLPLTWALIKSFRFLRRF